MSTEFKYNLEDKIAIITINDPDARVNNWCGQSELAFEKVILELGELAKEDKIEGAVIISGKPDTFLTGADLNELKKSATRKVFEANVSLLQLVLNSCNNLSVPTLAAINGACMGGGFEMALACDYRIATTFLRVLL